MISLPTTKYYFFSLCQTSSASIAWYGPKRTDECFLWFIWLKGLVQVAARAAPEAKAWFPWAHGIICGNYWSPFDSLYHDFVYHPPLHEQPQMFIPLLYKLPIYPKHTHINICHNVSFLFEMMQVFLYKEFLEGVPQVWNTLAESNSCSLNLPVYNFNCTLFCLRITDLSMLENNSSCL